MADPKTDAGALNGLQERVPRTIPRWARNLIFIFEIVFVAGLLAWWLAVPSLRESKSLWILFLYCFPAEFLIATVPHEPVLLYFGKFYGPLTVAAISGFGTVLTEILNYTFFKYVADLKVLKKMLESRSVQKAVHLFNGAPFLALWVAGFTPIPFYPFRFLVVLARYPIVKYLLAVILSRTPRMYLLALAGRAVRFPDYMLVILMAVLIFAANIPIIGKLLRRKKSGAAAAPPL